ncbi:MAG: redoxin domain-containing protein [Armatimonas sp.]
MRNKRQDKASQGILRAGVPSPGLEAATWIRGKPASFLGDRVTVVEFWATWCGPCKKAIPELTELAHKYKGFARFIGVSVRESDVPVKPGEASIPERVRAFVKSQGAKMAYDIAMDSADGRLTRSWLVAAAQETIPATFVIDREGRIAWIGISTDELGYVLALLQQGKPWTDLQPALDAKRTEDKQRRDAAMKLVDSLGSLKDRSQQLRVLEEAMQICPPLEREYGDLKLDWLLELKQTDAALKYLNGRYLSINGDSPSALSGAAWSLVRDDSIGKRYAPLARRLVQKAIELREVPDGIDYAALARTYYLEGDRAKAVVHQQKALELARTNPGFGASNIKALEKALERYKSGK